MNKHSVLILGATSDIGEAIAVAYDRLGAHIHLAGRSVSAIETRYQGRLRSSSVSLFDAVNFQSHAAFFDGLVPQPTIVVCVFGYLGDQKVAQTHFEEARKIVDTNFLGAVSILGHVATRFEAQRLGQIIGISSVAGERGRQSNYIYGAAKAGLTQYLSGLRNRLYRSNVHVMTVKPGFVATQMTAGMNLPKRLTARPEQVADAILRASQSRRDVLYVLPVWRIIMGIIRWIPESLFKRLSL